MAIRFSMVFQRKLSHPIKSANVSHKENIANQDEVRQSNNVSYRTIADPTQEDVGQLCGHFAESTQNQRIYNAKFSVKTQNSVLKWLQRPAKNKKRKDGSSCLPKQKMAVDIAPGLLHPAHIF